jgi:hypothetical protein
VTQAVVRGFGSPPRFVRYRSGCASMALSTGAIAGDCVGIHGVVRMALESPLVLSR